MENTASVLQSKNENDFLFLFVPEKCNYTNNAGNIITCKDINYKLYKF